MTREEHHLLTQVSEGTHLCLHFYGKEVSLHQLQMFEQSALKGHDYGVEVSGGGGGGGWGRGYKGGEWNGKEVSCTCEESIHLSLFT